MTRGRGKITPMHQRGMMILVLPLLAACSSSAGSHTSAPTVHAVVYKVTGDTGGTADLTLQTPSGQSQQNGVDVPVRNNAGDEGLHYSFPGGSFLYVSAQNQGVGALSCEIDVDGIPVSRNTSSGAYSIVTCQGRS